MITRQKRRVFLLTCLLSAIPFVVVSGLYTDVLVINRMLLAYATAVFARLGFCFLLTPHQKAPAITTASLILISAILCAGIVAWRAEHWALCSCGHPIDDIIPARFYLRPILSALFLILTSYCAEYSALRGKYNAITTLSFYIACAIMAYTALPLADV